MTYLKKGNLFEENWIDGEGEGFLRNYHDLPQAPRRKPQLMEKGLIVHSPFRGLFFYNQGKEHKTLVKRKKEASGVMEICKKP